MKECQPKWRLVSSRSSFQMSPDSHCVGGRTSDFRLFAPIFFFYNQSSFICVARNHIKIRLKALCTFRERKKQLVLHFFFLPSFLSFFLFTQWPCSLFAPLGFVCSCYERKIGLVAGGKQIDSNVATRATVKLSLEDGTTVEN